MCFYPYRAGIVCCQLVSNFRYFSLITLDKALILFVLFLTVKLTALARIS